MKVILAKSAGFCYGVRRAVELAQQAAAGEGPRVMLGSIIHNKDEMARLTALGLGVIASPEEAPPGGTVVIRSHGEGKAVYQALEERGVRVVDATCPNVSRIHQIVAQAEARGRQPVIVGKHDHPEVLAIAGWCRRPVVVSGGEELEEWLKKAPEYRTLPLTFVSQTTAIRASWENCVKKAQDQEVCVLESSDPSFQVAIKLARELGLC